MVVETFSNQQNPLISRLINQQQAAINQQLDYRSTSLERDEDCSSTRPLKGQISLLLKSLKRMGWKKSIVQGEAGPCISARTYSEYTGQIIEQTRLFSDRDSLFPHSVDNLRCVSRAGRIHLQSLPTNGTDSVSLLGNGGRSRRLDRMYFVPGRDSSTDSLSESRLGFPALHSSPYIECGIPFQKQVRGQVKTVYRDTHLQTSDSNADFLWEHRHQNTTNRSLPTGDKERDVPNLSQTRERLRDDRPTLRFPNFQPATLAPGACELLRRGTALVTQNIFSEVGHRGADYPADFLGAKELVLSLLSVSHSGCCQGRCINAFCTVTALSAKQVR
jgi:hypothetical protein